MIEHYYPIPRGNTRSDRTTQFHLSPLMVANFKYFDKQSQHSGGPAWPLPYSASRTTLEADTATMVNSYPASSLFQKYRNRGTDKTTEPSLFLGRYSCFQC